MPLRKANQLPRRFAQLTCRSERIDIAVAWARPCEAIEILVRSDATIRIAVGISKNFTDPSTLKRLANLPNVELRIVPDSPPRIFHPKYYSFHGDKTTFWIGSANLTGGGFGGNAELIHEFKSKKDEYYQWFECLWENLNPDPWPEILEYEEGYIPPGRDPRPLNPGEVDEAPLRQDLPMLSDINTWEHFVEGLKVYDRHYRCYGSNFDVLGETHSWLHTIGIGHEVAVRPDWVNLARRECYILRGFAEQDNDECVWGFLGTLRQGRAPEVFNEDNMPRVGHIREQIRELLNPVLNSGPENISETAQNAMMEMRQIDRIGPAAATRWLALARPEYLVSVNRESAPGLSRAAWLSDAVRLPRTREGLANAYPRLLSWLHNRPWFNEPQPEDPLERVIWSYRAALVDVFVYKE